MGRRLPIPAARPVLHPLRTVDSARSGVQLLPRSRMRGAIDHQPLAGHRQLAQAQANEFGEPDTPIVTFIRAYYRTSSAIGAISEPSQDYILCQMLHLEEQRAGKRACTNGRGLTT